MISSIPVADSTYLNQYRGLLLSCRQVYTEFEPEALKNVDAFFKRLHSTTTHMLEVPKIEKLAHTVLPQVEVEKYNDGDWGSWYDYSDGSSVYTDWSRFNVKVFSSSSVVDFFSVVKDNLEWGLGLLQLYAGRSL
jgi:hypothetical protein